MQQVGCNLLAVVEEDIQADVLIPYASKKIRSLLFLMEKFLDLDRRRDLVNANKQNYFLHILPVLWSEVCCF